MAKRDRVQEVAETVERLAQAVELELETRRELSSRVDRLERALEGFSRMGEKVGALATALDRNARLAEEARDRMVNHQTRVLDELRGAGLRPPPVRHLEEKES